MNMRGAYLFGRGAKESSKRQSDHPLAIYKRMRAAGITVSPFDTCERRVVGKKIVNVEYHKIDWAKNFAANGNAR